MIFRALEQIKIIKYQWAGITVFHHSEIYMETWSKAK